MSWRSVLKIIDVIYVNEAYKLVEYGIRIAAYHMKGASCSSLGY